MSRIRFSAATYNVHRCVGRDRVRDPGRIARVVRELNAAIVGLQEVETLFSGEPLRDQLSVLSEDTGMIAIPGPAFFRTDGHYGNVLLTTGEVIDIRRHDLSVPRREPRGILDVDVGLGGHVIRVLVAHLGLGWRERGRQIDKIWDLVAAADGGPLILLGDFNEWWPWSRRLHLLHRRFGNRTDHATFPTRWPFLALDKVWVWPPRLVREVRVHRSALAGIASDHLPLKVDIQIEARVRTSPMAEVSLMKR